MVLLENDVQYIPSRNTNSDKSQLRCELKSHNKSFPPHFMGFTWHGFLLRYFFFFFFYKCDADLKSTEMDVEPRLTDLHLVLDAGDTPGIERKSIKCSLCCVAHFTASSCSLAHTHTRTVVIDSRCRWTFPPCWIMVLSFYARREKKYWPWAPFYLFIK